MNSLRRCVSAVILIIGYALPLVKVSEWMFMFPHLPHQEYREEKPWGIGQGHDDGRTSSMGSPVFFAHDDEYIGKEDAGIDDGGNADPVFSLDKGINGKEVVGAEEYGIEPYRGFPPGWPCPLQGVETAAPPVNHIDQEWQGPERIPEIIGVLDDQLFQVDDVGDVEKVQEEKGQVDVVGFAVF